MKKTIRKQKNLAAFAKETLSKIEINKLKGGDDPIPPIKTPPPPKGGG